MPQVPVRSVDGGLAAWPGLSDQTLGGKSPAGAAVRQRVCRWYLPFESGNVTERLKGEGGGILVERPPDRPTKRLWRRTQTLGTNTVGAIGWSQGLRGAPRR